MGDEVPEEKMELDSEDHEALNDTTEEPENLTIEDAYETDSVSEQKVESRLPLAQPVERKPKENEPENLVSDFTQGLKLKKAAVIKKPIEKTALDLPKLKHHEFENVP